MTQSAQASSAHAILNGGKVTPILTHILEFAGDLDHVEVARFNRAFHGAVQLLQTRVCSRLARVECARAITTSDEVSCLEKFNEAWKDISVLAEQLKDRLVGFFGSPLSNVFEKHWRKIVQLKNGFEEEADPARREIAMKNLLSHLPAIQKELSNLLKRYALDTNLWLDFRADDPFPELQEAMKRYIASENLVRRARETLANNLHPQKTRLAILHENQQTAVNKGHERLQVNPEQPRTFSLARYIQAEEMASAAELDREAGLISLWEGITKAFRVRNIVINNPPRTPKEIEAWINAEQHAQLLEKVAILNFGEKRLSDLPPEIGKLKNLQFLWCNGNRLHRLPPEISNLAELQTLDLSYNAFQEIPEILVRVRKLRSLEMSGNQIRDFNHSWAYLPLSVSQGLRLMNNPIDGAGLPNMLAEVETNRAALWSAIHVQLQELGIELPVIPRTLEEIHAWLNDEANEQILARIEKLYAPVASHGMPPEIRRLRNLQELHWNGNGTQLPEEFDQLIHLQRLDISGFADTLPRVSRLIQLRSLALRGIQNPEELQNFRGLGNLVNLSELNLSGNRLQIVPPWIASLRNLEALVLARNNIRELPLFLAELPHLRILDVGGNQIDALPEEIYLGPLREDIEFYWPWLTISQFSRLPFRLWFRRNWTITCPPLFNEFRRLAEIQQRFGLILALLLLPVACFGEIFSASIRLLNWIVVEPLVLFRNRFGYARLVDVHRRPQE